MLLTWRVRNQQTTHWSYGNKWEEGRQLFSGLGFGLLLSLKVRYYDGLYFVGESEMVWSTDKLLFALWQKPKLPGCPNNKMGFFLQRTGV
jgi:hypothetical protein